MNIEKAAIELKSILNGRIPDQKLLKVVKEFHEEWHGVKKEVQFSNRWLNWKADKIIKEMEVK